MQDIERFYERAGACEALAERAIFPAERASFIDMATTWRQMAADIEAEQEADSPQGH